MSDGSTPLAPGALIADIYEVERKLGQGGMGEVWLAKHRRLAGKQVAIKVLHVDRALPAEALKRFRQEAEIAARLEHPNIVQVSDFNTLPTGEPYLVMEYLKGQSLAARARGRVLPLEQLVPIMRQVGAALQAAHRAGVVHRDLKPDNFFLVPTALGDQVKVLDFGISKLSDSSMTTDSVLLGTPLYMSPEQALGNNKEVTPQSDVFSLGSICYELLTGQPPFLADNLAKIVFRIAYEPHRPLAELRPDLPAPVLAAVEHALEKDRAKRTPGIEAFVQELTGQPLAEVSAADDETSGVYTPGMVVTPSMMSGATLGPATPSPGSPAPSVSSGAAAVSAPPVARPAGPPAAPAGPRTVSGKVFIVTLGVVVLGIAAVVTRVRLDNWADRAEYRAGMLDAGYVMLPDGTFVRDAGAAPAPAVDAGVLAAVTPVDAGAGEALPAQDAGGVAVVAGPPPGAEPARTRIDAEPKPVPATTAELALLATLERHRQDQNWERLSELRTRVFNDLKTPTAASRGLLLIVEGLCERHDLVLLRSVIPRVRALGPAQSRKAKALCVPRYPDAAALDW